VSRAVSSLFDATPDALVSPRGGNLAAALGDQGVQGDDVRPTQPASPTSPRVPGVVLDDTGRYQSFGRRLRTRTRIRMKALGIPTDMDLAQANRNAIAGLNGPPRPGTPAQGLLKGTTRMPQPTGGIWKRRRSVVEEAQPTPPPSINASPVPATPDKKW